MTFTYGSDVMVALLQRLGIRYVAANPGASFRGLHDSLTTAGQPELISALHEGVAIAIAHGYAKASGEMMAAAVHNLVGLQNATMATFNAYADHAPILVLGGSGPADQAHRRPWIDWVHTANQQGQVVRDVVKWDAEPASIEAVPDLLLRAHQLAAAQPQGPTYVALDALLQERPAPPIDLGDWGPAPIAAPTAPLDRLEAVADLLLGAESPVILADHVGRSRAGFDALRRLAETLAAPVVDLGGRHNFPTGHWADCTGDRAGRLAEADVILALDCRDVRWALSRVDNVKRGHHMLSRPDARLAVITLNDLKHNGFLDLEPPIRAHEHLLADTAVALPVLADLVDERVAARRDAVAARRKWLTGHTAGLRAALGAPPESPTGGISEGVLAAATYDAVRDGPWQIGFNMFRGWPRRTWDMVDYNCHLGGSGGGGLGFGAGGTIGAALHHRDDDTVVVGLQPDGDLLYTPQALWTAAHHQIPVLMVVVDNRSYGADWLHQKRVVDTRGGDLERARHGMDLTGPHVDHAAMARAQGVEAFGPVEDRAALPGVLAEAVKAVRGGNPVLVDVVVDLPVATES
ncbi:MULTISPECIES: thiamine pyrophosphate-binding protein [Micromonospora]|uniref:Benzoylformate decarboxylase n=1 Tax=Micromonospora yangpuensis TaxID=683228 RepID=A0A1C6UPL5_9ACTN|nr:thiamine pyrophosphate-binding protein [Micromonospora yangpuensis]GGM08410.1 thiamine pyrophosphate-binding protein [Micromonospora yangpuensis]SCL55910.1 benzoylformate decarboxylase [Micromonospora yangpuensis]